MKLVLRICMLMMISMFVNVLSLQGAIFTMHGNNDGYATGSKDGTVILWDNGFKPITKLDMINTPVGYEGELRSIFVWVHSSTVSNLIWCVEFDQLPCTGFSLI